MSIHKREVVATRVYCEYQPTCAALFETAIGENVFHTDLKRELLVALDKALEQLAPGDTLIIQFEAWETTKEGDPRT